MPTESEVCPMTYHVCESRIARPILQVSRSMNMAARLGEDVDRVPQRVKYSEKELVRDALVGLAVFKFAGGRFRSILPSDVRFPGALARATVPARGADYATHAAKQKLVTLYRRWGCHHCGKKSGRVIGDHMPPNISAHGNTKGRLGPVNWQEPGEALNRLARQCVDALPNQWLRNRLRVDPPSQRFYPQCEDCSLKQSKVS